MPLSIEQFGKSLSAAGLVSVDELKALWSELPAEAKPKDGDAFARLLVDRGKLTDFQAKHVAAGRGGGLVFGEYVLVDLIGEGGMGKVYKARHRRMARTVALKVMSAAAMRDEAAVKRFQREVRAAAKLEHPQIVTAYDAGQAGSTHYLVMQFVDGGDLAERVKKHGPLAVGQAVNYVVQAARGLAFAHGEGVVHRDIKPANLLVDKKGVVKILDMGLARIEGADGLTATEQVMGTVDYMSPEQAADTKNADARSDVYALGCTLWFLLTGKKLYDGDSMISRLMKHRDASLPSLLKERDDAPWGVEQALHKMIAKRADERFASMDDVIAALDSYGDSGGGSMSGIGSSGGMSSAIDSSSGPRNVELSDFFKGIAPQSGSVGKIATNTKGDSRPDVTASLSAAKSDTDSGVRPRSAVMAKPKASKPPLLLIGGGVLGSVVLIGSVVFVLTRGGNNSIVDETEASATGVVPAVASRIPVVVASGLPTLSRAAAPQKPTTPYDFLTSPDYEWSEPENLGPVVNSIAYEGNPCLSADGLTLLFDSDRPGGQGSRDLWQCRRTSLDAPWSTPENLGPPVNTARSDGGPSLSADGLMLYFHSDGLDPGHGAQDLAFTVRKSPTAPWSEPQALGATINDSSNAEYPELSADGLSLVFTSYSPGGFGRADLWQSTRRDTASSFGFSAPLKPAVNSDTEDRAPTLSSDGRVVIFYRVGVSGGIGGTDLWMSTRAATNAPWAPPQPLPKPVNLTSNEEGPHVTADGKTLLFHSNRGNNIDLWMSRRVPKRQTAKPPDDAPVATDDPVLQRLESPDYAWTPPENLGTNVNSARVDRSPTLTADELSLVFYSNRHGEMQDFFESRRSSISEPFGPAERIAAVQTAGTVAGCCLSADGLALYFYATAGPNHAGDRDVYVVRRTTRDAPWQPIENIGPGVNGPAQDSGPGISPDGLSLAFTSNRPGGMGALDLYVSRRNSLGEPFGPAENLGANINSAADDKHPRFLADNRTIVFDRGDRLFRTTRSSVGTERAVSLPEPAPQCAYAWVSPDGARMYFVAGPRTLSGGQGDDDLWVSHRIAKKN